MHESRAKKSGPEAAFADSLCIRSGLYPELAQDILLLAHAVRKLGHAVRLAQHVLLARLVFPEDGIPERVVFSNQPFTGRQCLPLQRVQLALELGTTVLAAQQLFLDGKTF